MQMKRKFYIIWDIQFQKSGIIFLLGLRSVEVGGTCTEMYNTAQLCLSNRDIIISMHTVSFLKLIKCLLYFAQ